MGVYAGVTTEYLTQDDASKIAPALLKYRIWAKSKGATDLGRPTVDFNFADNKSLVDEVSGNSLIDFARSTTATYVGSDGLIKTSPVNLLPYSEQFDQWNDFGNTVLSNSVKAPNETVTADTVTINAAYASVLTYHGNFAAEGGTAYTFSIWLKADSPRNFGYIFYDDVSGVQSGTFSVTTNWERFEVTKTYGVGSTDQRVGIGWNTVTTAYAWGAQIEKDITANDYLPTSGTKSGAPRFDHDPLTGECRGLLIEEGRTNLVSTSIPSGWGDFNRTTETTGITAPDGSTDAKNYDNTGGTVNDFVYVNVNTTLSTGDSYVISVFSNKSETDISQGGLASGKYTALGSTQHIQYQNGWYRHWRAYEATQDNPNITPQIVIYTSGTLSNQTLWGLQVEPVLETNSFEFPTSYIPTSGSQVTRSPDLTEIDGTNFTSWYNSSESTIYSEFNGFIPTGATGAYFGSNTNGWGFYSSTTSNIVNKGSTNHSPDGGSFSVSNGQISEFRGAISQSDVDGETSYAVNGSMIATDATRSGPYSLTGSHIGMSVSAADTGSESQTRGSFVVRRTTYWNRRVTNAVLESLTE
jgi:hypothetical protein